MSEPQWEELVRSPLDEPSTTRSSSDSWRVVGAGLLIGVIVGAAAGWFAREEPETQAAPPSSTTTTVEVTPDPIVPPGYVDVGGVALGQLASFTAGEFIYVVVGEATRSDAVPEETTPFHAGRWAFVDPGSTPTDREVLASLTPGLRALEFDLPGPPTGATLNVWEGTKVVTRDGCNGCGSTSTDREGGESEMPYGGLPAELGEPIVAGVAGSLSLVIDRLSVAEEWGYVEWRLEGDESAVARVSVNVTFVGTDDPSSDQEDPTRLVPYDEANIQFGIGHARGAPAFARSGDIPLTRIGEPIGGNNQVEGLAISWSVEWTHPAGDPWELESP